METQFKYYMHGAHEEVAEWVAEQSHSQFAEEQPIVPVEPKDICQNYAGVAAVQGMAVVAYVGAKRPVWIEENSRSLSQISTLIVDKEYQGQGIGSELIDIITREVAEGWVTPFTFCGPNIRPAFERAAYGSLQSSESLPPHVSSAFGNPALIYQGPIGNYLLD